MLQVMIDAEPIATNDPAAGSSTRGGAFVPPYGHVLLEGNPALSGEHVEGGPGPRHHEGIDGIGLADLTRRPALTRHQLRRDAHDLLAASKQEALEAAGDMTAVLEGPQPRRAE